MSLPSKLQLPCKLHHRLLGDCTLVRMEGVQWVVAFGNMELRVSPSQFAAYKMLETPPDSPSVEVAGSASVLRREQLAPPLMAPTPAPERVKRAGVEYRTGGEDDGQLGPGQLPATKRLHPSEDEAPPSPIVLRARLRRAIRSLATGLSPEDPNLTLSLSVGLDAPFDALKQFYKKVSSGGAALVIRGAYGCGKTLTLQSAKAKALANNFVCSETEIDSSEVRLDQAPTVYATLIRSLRFPDGGRGLDHLLDLFEQWLAAERAPYGSAQLYDWLVRRIECSYLAWMLAARNLRQSKELIEALKGAPIPVSKLRRVHPLPNASGRWQYFKFGTQGDVGSYLISGVSQLVKLLGFNGLIMALDEMEKWQDLDWKNQDRASNLLGGLIWGAAEPEGSRQCTAHAREWTCPHSPLMLHSAFNGGCPFSTPSRCNLGLLIAMTPRGEAAPEHIWQEYGDLKIIDLPRYTLASFLSHFTKITAVFEKAYEVEIPRDVVLKSAESMWRNSSDRSARSGSLAITDALENWRRHNG